MTITSSRFAETVIYLPNIVVLTILLVKNDWAFAHWEYDYNKIYEGYIPLDDLEEIHYKQSDEINDEDDVCTSCIFGPIAGCTIVATDLSDGTQFTFPEGIAIELIRKSVKEG